MEFGKHQGLSQNVRVVATIEGEDVCWTPMLLLLIYLFEKGILTFHFRFHWQFVVYVSLDRPLEAV
jgi:hypothetical protein